MPLRRVCRRVRCLVPVPAPLVDGFRRWELDAALRIDLEAVIRTDLVADLDRMVVVDLLGQEDPGDGSAVGFGCDNTLLQRQRPHPQQQLLLGRHHRNQALVPGLEYHRVLRLVDQEDHLGREVHHMGEDLVRLEDAVQEGLGRMDQGLVDPGDVVRREDLGHKQEGCRVPVDSHQAQHAEVDLVQEDLDLAGFEVGYEHP